MLRAFAARVFAVLGVAVAAAATLTPPQSLGAQGSRRVDQSAAELLVAEGRLDDAERVLFAESRRAPREPSARGALGAFLAARGKFLVGATLLDEALYFGGDSSAIESRLFDVYRWAGLFDRAAALRHSRASQVERDAMARAAGTAAGGARTATVPMLPNDGLGLGRITIVVGGERLEADIQPTGSGLVLPSSMPLFSAIEAVGARGDTTFGAARSVAIGGLTLGPVPVRLVPSVRTARIGLDLLALVHPTFDPRAQTLTVRAEGVPSVGDQMLPILLGFPAEIGVVARDGQGPVGLHTAAGRAAVRGKRWTFELFLGAMIVEP